MALMITDLFALSDALQMELEIIGDAKISGSIKRVIEVPEIGLKMNQLPKICTSKVVGLKNRLGPDVAALLHVQGDLFLCMLHDRTSEDLLRLMIVDQARSADDMTALFSTYPKNGLPSLLKLIRRATVAEFKKGVYDTTWARDDSLLKA